MSVYNSVNLKPVQIIEPLLKTVTHTAQLRVDIRCLPLTTLCADDDEGATKVFSSLLAGTVNAFAIATKPCGM